MKPDSQSEIFSENLADLASGELLQLWKQGNESAAGLIVDRYAIRLVALVASKMNRRFRDSVDPEDIVQSAMGSFFLAARQSRIQVSQSVSLWRLLAIIVKRKMLRSIEYLSATRRGGDGQRVILDSILQDWAKDPTADFSFNELTEGLPVELTRLAELMLSGLSQREIADSLGIHERTVRRRLAQLQTTLAREAGIDEQVTNESNSVSFASDLLPRIGYHEFVLGRLVGAGGFGKVYRAAMQNVGEGTDPIVAVKFLRKAFWRDLSAKQRFLQEVEQAAQIDHPSVVRYLGWGESPQGGPYVLMQWIDGVALSECRELNAESFLKILGNICDALACVHKLGIVHGDLSPANILIDQAQHAWITDFGFSQSVHEYRNDKDPNNPNEKLLGGTPGFAAPEQLSESFGQISPATDIYAIGGLAYWYLTGEPPHAAESFEASFADTISSDDTDTSHICVSSPAAKRIKRIATVCLHKTVNKRPCDAVELMKVFE